MDSYSTRSLESASGVDLVIALYDGIIRFMRRAIDAVDAGDPSARRAAVKRAMEIVIHLQATLRRDVGGKPAESLEQFYVSIFALMLQGSQANAKEKFEQVIACVWNVRDAWRQVASNLAVREAGLGDHWNLSPGTSARAATASASPDAEFATGWTV
jgi:flagellar secretion chaperone FliS